MPFLYLNNPDETLLNISQIASVVLKDSHLAIRMSDQREFNIDGEDANRIFAMLLMDARLPDGTDAGTLVIEALAPEGENLERPR